MKRHIARRFLPILLLALLLPAWHHLWHEPVAACAVEAGILHYCAAHSEHGDCPSCTFTFFSLQDAFAFIAVFFLLFSLRGDGARNDRFASILTTSRGPPFCI